jgi:putative endonuclease
VYFVYLLRNTNGQYYIGYSGNLDRRMEEHQRGIVKTTNRLGFYELVYYEAYPDETSAKIREKKLKQFGSSYQGLLKRLGLK